MPSPGQRWRDISDRLVMLMDTGEDFSYFLLHIYFLLSYQAVYQANADHFFNVYEAVKNTACFDTNDAWPENRDPFFAVMARSVATRCDMRDDPRVNDDWTNESIDLLYGTNAIDENKTENKTEDRTKGDGQPQNRIR